MSAKASLRIVELLERARTEGDWIHVSQVSQSFKNLIQFCAPLYPNTLESIETGREKMGHLLDALI